MFYLKRVISKFNKYFKHKKKIRYKKLEASSLKNITSNSVSKNVRSYSKNLLLNNEISFSANKKKLKTN